MRKYPLSLKNIFMTTWKAGFEFGTHSPRIQCHNVAKQEEVALGCSPPLFSSYP